MNDLVREFLEDVIHGPVGGVPFAEYQHYLERQARAILEQERINDTERRLQGGSGTTDQPSTETETHHQGNR